MGGKGARTNVYLYVRKHESRHLQLSVSYCTHGDELGLVNTVTHVYILFFMSADRCFKR